MLQVTNASIKKQTPENHTPLLQLAPDAPCTHSPSCLSWEKQRRKRAGAGAGGEHCRYRFRDYPFLPLTTYKQIPWMKFLRTVTPLEKDNTCILTPLVGVKWKHFCADS